MFKYRTVNYLDYRRRLRYNQTPAEAKLWSRLRGGRFYGYKFRRQQSLGPYIYDFYCFKLKLIIEVDGSQHLGSKIEDGVKTSFAVNRGFKVLRYWNSDVLENIDGVLEDILNNI